MWQIQEMTYVNPVLAGYPTLENLAMLDRAADALASGLVEEALDRVFKGLQQIREDLSTGDWADFARYIREQHELRGAMYQDPLTKRAYDKPRGYAGDAVMLDYVYGIHYGHEAAAQASPLGRRILRYIQEGNAGREVRYRRQHLAQLIDAMAARGSEPNVLAVASGHLREAELCKTLRAGRVGRLVAFDADAESLREVETHYGRLGVETVQGSVRHLLAGKVKLGTFDFVYAAGLYDYLGDDAAEALTARLFEMTKPGGLLLIPNFAPWVRERAYMETFMDWRLIYRNRYEMAMLAVGLDAAQIERFEVYSGPTNSVFYLAVMKAAG